MTTSKQASRNTSGAPYQALCRWPDLINDRTLVITGEPNPPSEWLALVRQRQCHVHSWISSVLNDYPEAQRHAELLQADQLQAESIILVWPKSKELGRCLLQLCASRYRQITIMGANDAGGKSIPKAAPDLISQATKLDSARRCSLWQVELTTADQPSFNWLHQAQSFNHQGQGFLTLPGVFSHGRLDIGTQVLLEYLPAPAKGRILDLGCGSGVIGLSMKSRNPDLEVVLSDVDWLATRSTELNALRHGLEVDVINSDGMDDITGQFDFIISNPPFHQGTKTNYAFAERLFTDARRQLVSQGQLWIVANRHLAYEEWAREAFQHVEVMAQEQGFKLIVAC